MNSEYIISSFKTAAIYTIEYLFVLAVFGVVFSMIEKRNSRAIVNVFGRNGLIITGLIGTVVHEFSHMLMCLIFKHEIIEYSLFRPFKSRYDGVMGYVNHRCNLNSTYQKKGNFFIGIAPIFFGTVFLMLFMRILLPNEFGSISQDFERNMIYMSSIKSITDSLNIYVNIVLSVISNLSPFKEHNIILYIIYIYIVYSVTTHMDLSLEDLKNSSVGLGLFIAIIFIINLIVVLLGSTLLIEYLKTVITMFAFLSVSIIFAILTMIISIILEVFL